MLKSTTERYQSFIDFITSKKIVDVPCLVVIIPNYPAIMADDGSRKMGFACYTPSYLPEYGLMYVAADRGIIAKELSIGTPEDYVPTEAEIDEEVYCRIAHEYYHHIQCVKTGDITDEEAADEEAEKWADWIIDEFKRFLYRMGSQ